MKNNKHRTIAALLCVAWMVLIFAFSATDATESSEQSKGVTAFVVNVILELFTDMTEGEKEIVSIELEPKVREFAHFTLFFVLSSLYYYLAVAFGKSIKNCALLSFFGAVVYAVTDEIHQYFIPGRTMQLGDVITDSFGAALASVLLSLLHLTIKKKKAGKYTAE